MMEIQKSSLFLNQDRYHESDSLFTNQAEPFHSSSFAIESMEIPVPSFPVGEIIPSIEAVDWNKKGHNVDIRPRLVDSSSGEARLLDSGAQLSAARKGPNDTLDESVKLVAVNGSKIPTYGTRDLVVKINRKTYRIKAVVCDIKQDILGFDFITKYKLNLEWDDFDQSELFLVDKKAKIRKSVKIVTVPTTITRAHHLESVASPVNSSYPSSASPPSDSKVPLSEVSARSSARVATTAFEISCMKELTKPENKGKLSSEIFTFDL